MDSSTLVAVVFALVAALLGYVYLTARADRQKAGQEAFPLFDDEVDMPDATEWDKVKAERPDKPGTALELWHKKACAVLFKRAQAGLRPFHMARRKLNEFAYLKQNEKQLGKAVSEAAWTSAQERLRRCEEEHERVRAEAAWLQPGQPGWDHGIYQEATDALRAKQDAKQAEGKRNEQPRGSESDDSEPLGEDVQDLASRFEGGIDEAELWWLRPLRFKVSERVWCNMGPQGWLPGHVVGDWCLPYVVIMDNGARASCPADVPQLIRADQPEESELAQSHQGAQGTGDTTASPADAKQPAIPLSLKQLWRPYRFKPGDKAEIKVTNQHKQEMWLPCTVAMHNYRQDDWPQDRIAAYMVMIELPNQPQPTPAFAPIDHESIIRARQK